MLRRAAELVGPMRAATRPVSEEMREPHQGELDVERTLENITGKEFPDAGDWVVTRRQERRQQVVLMMDTSLSMSGEKMALAAVATAVLALKMQGERLGRGDVRGQGQGHQPAGVDDSPEEVVRLMLEQPVRGYTNIAAALEVGAAELERGRNPRRAGLLITDGVYTVGEDPVPLAARFPRLFVLLTEDYKMNPGLCRSMADQAGGDVFPVKSFQELPRRMLEVANRVLR